MTTIANAMILILVISLIEAVGLTTLRMKNQYSIPVASIIYAIMVIPLLYLALKYEGIGMVNFIWNVFSTVLMFTIGVYLFNEKLHNLQIVGVLLSLLGLFLILITPE
jgi:multidrug transporter EmrE-like cation transporter